MSCITLSLINCFSYLNMRLPLNLHHYLALGVEDLTLVCPQLPLQLCGMLSSSKTPQLIPFYISKASDTVNV